ncbi:iron chelate uptake ABC transporter family permease subunit [Gluconacetobacter sacchari]|uniref:iron chelate uptake ABC transporter family permease subunit n=1 Tax=Gluconacetobacter sacchari TaxID=92759 RepID=UPI0039B3A808
MGYPVERTKRLPCSPSRPWSGRRSRSWVATGPDHRLVLPASALLGVTLLTLSDSLARVIAAPAEVPVGIVTAVIGAPAFVWLLTRMRDPEIRLQPCSSTEADRDRSRPPSFRLRRSCRTGAHHGPVLQAGDRAGRDRPRNRK